MERKGSALILLLASPMAMGVLSIGVPQLVVLVFYLLGFSLPALAALALAIFIFAGAAVAG